MVQEKSVVTKFTTLFIDPTVWKKIMYYTQAASGEVSGLGVITKDERNRHIVSDVYLLEQEASAADTELKPEAISKLMVDMMKDNKDPATLKFWWHSHASMGVFWSGTDDTCAETLSKEFAFSLVVNKAGDKRCRLDLYSPFRITFDGVKVEELIVEDVDLKKECEKEVAEKVKTAFERYNNWKDTDYDSYKDYYGGKYDWRDRNFSDKKKSLVTLPEVVVSDIKRLLSFSDINTEFGGTLYMDTWKSFINETLRDMVEKRFEKKASCNSVATFDANYAPCNKECKIRETCRYWTKLLDESEEDAEKFCDNMEKRKDKEI